MATLSLRVYIADGDVTKTMQFDPSTSVYDICKIIRDKILEANRGEPKEYGLFLSDDDAKKGVWLEPGRSLEYYILRNGDLLEYRKKLRTLRVQMLDGTLKTMMIDDSQPVANLMVVICTKIGITNHDEYGLVRECTEDETDKMSNNYGTLTLRRKKEERERDVKMDQLRKKLKTDDEVNWVDPSKTLREQGIDEGESVLLRRKFFFSDGNIDAHDPVQLNLLYVQARDAVLDGTHPVMEDLACQLAGIQVHIQFGNHNEAKHKPPFLDLKEFLPHSYIKTKGIEKKVFLEHKKQYGLSELDAKVLYTKTCRSLSTYGVTFFLVKEKMKGKNKLVPRLLGVTKDSVLRLDERTKEILKTWPLTTVRRWGASPNTFTLDFGDYSDQYYSVQTREAEQILHLIAGYIDIILKKKRAKDHFGIEGDEGSTMIEDSICPSKASILQHESNRVGKINTESVAKPAVMRAGTDGSKQYGLGHVGNAQYTTISGQITVGHSPMVMQQSQVTNVMTGPQNALLSTISCSKETIKMVEAELMSKAVIPELGIDSASMKWKETTFDTNKQNVSSQIAAMNAATAQIINLTSEQVDYNEVSAAITSITTNLPEMSHGVRMMAALTTNGDELLEAARKLCSAFSELLNAVQPQSNTSRQYLLNAASHVGEASQYMLREITEEDDSKEILLDLAKVVANTTAVLVIKAKSIASTVDHEQQPVVIGAATKCALAASQLVACTKVVASTLDNPICRNQLVTAAKEVINAIEDLVSICSISVSEDNSDLLRDLNIAAAEVTVTLNRLLNHIKLKDIEEGVEETIIVSSERILTSTNDTSEMLKQARILGQATAQLIQSIKGEAERELNSEIQHNLLTAAKDLAEATARMVEAARLCASNPNNVQTQNELRQTVEELRAAANPTLRNKLSTRLRNAAKFACSTGNQCIVSSQAVSKFNVNKLSQEELISECKVLSNQIPVVVDSIKTIDNSEHAQIAIINACEQFVPAATRVIQSGRAVLPTISHEASTLQLSQSIQQFSNAINDLRSVTCHTREVFSEHSEVDSAKQSVAGLKNELRMLYKSIETLQLRALPGETAQSASEKVCSSTKVINQVASQLVSSALQENDSYTSTATREFVNSLSNLTLSVRGVAATSGDKSIQRKIVTKTENVISISELLIEKCYSKPVNSDTLHSAVKEVSLALSDILNCLPLQNEIDEIIIQISSTCENLIKERQKSTRPYPKLQQELNQAAMRLNEASAEVVSSVDSPSYLAKSSKEFGSTFQKLINVGSEVANHSHGIDIRTQIILSLKNVSFVSSNLLHIAKTVSVDATALNSKNQLSVGARAVTESINNLINACTSASPSQKECDSAVRNIHAMRPILYRPSEPINDASYFECLDIVVEKSKNLGDGMTGIANHGKRSDHEQFSTSVRTVSDAICGLTEAAAQSAYLIAISEPTSIVGQCGLVDQAQFSRAHTVIKQACSNLTNSNSTQQQVLSSATTIAKYTSSLCNACRVASSKTTNPVAKRHFVQAAKDVANATANLVKEIKALDLDYNEPNRHNCASATHSLLSAMDSLIMFASSSEFSNKPARISEIAYAAQKPILNASDNIITSSCNMITTAKLLIVNPKDPPTWQLLANHSKQVSESIKNLVSLVRDCAPGQKECQSAIQRIQNHIKDLDQVSLAAISQKFLPRKNKSVQGFLEQTDTSSNEIISRIEPLREAAKFKAENIGHLVDQLVLYFESLVLGTIGASSNILYSKQQMALLDQTKTVAECILQLIYVTKQSGGNPKAKGIHPEVDEAIDSTRESLLELTNSLEQYTGIMNTMIQNITQSMQRIPDSHHYGSIVIDTADSNVDYHTKMVNTAKNIAILVQEMMGKPWNNEGSKIGIDLSHSYSELAQDCVQSMAIDSNPDTYTRLCNSIHGLGTACVNAITAAASPSNTANYSYSSRDRGDATKVVTEKVSHVLSALQASSRGTQACINAASAVSGIIGDLDTIIMFATAGTLHAEKENETFADHRENILKTAKALVEDTKTLVAGAASSQEQLAVAAQNTVSTIIQLAEVVKCGAASLGSDNPESQVMLINAIKDVATALGDLIQATKSASGKGASDPSMANLKDSAKVMVTNVTSLLKTVKVVEDEHLRGTRALESAIEAIGVQEIRALGLPSIIHGSKGTPEELIRSTKAITLATAKAVAAGNSCKQEDIIIAANMGRKAISDMLAICKSCSNNAESEDLRQRVLQVGRDTALTYRELLQTVLNILHPNQTILDPKQALAQTSRKIAQCVTELVSVAELLKGTNWVDPDDPTMIAENELLGAAASIDAAAKKLASLRPRQSIQETDESLNFDEMILEAAKSIAAATSALVKAASAAQRELIDAGKMSRTPLMTSDDGQWSEGLISAARLVAVATHSLVESANALVQGIASEEKLISSAKLVASSTAQLLVACKVKADPESDTTKRLQAAGNAVKRATDNLVRAAQQAIQHDEERSLILNKRMVGGIAQEINARSDVLRIERELEEARSRLTAIRQAKYKVKGDENAIFDESDSFDSYTA